MKDTLYIIVPAYNEQANILNVINQWYPVISAHSANGTSRLVIIDDGSKDNYRYRISRRYCRRFYLSSG